MSRELRASELLGQRVRDSSGVVLGRVADIETEPGPGGGPRVVALVVMAGPWGRLLGYERAEIDGPWLLETVARWILRRNMRRVPWETAVLD
jgi:sporulation protein YlmC with PRC-barrel domain